MTAAIAIATKLSCHDFILRQGDPSIYHLKGSDTREEKNFTTFCQKNVYFKVMFSRTASWHFPYFLRFVARYFDYVCPCSRDFFVHRRASIMTRYKDRCPKTLASVALDNISSEAMLVRHFPVWFHISKIKGFSLVPAELCQLSFEYHWLFIDCNLKIVEYMVSNPPKTSSCCQHWGF